MSTRFKGGFVGVLSCLALMLSIFFATGGVVSAHAHQQAHQTDTTWGYVITGVSHAYSGYQGHNLQDPINTHYELIDARFTNREPFTEVLNQPLFHITSSDGTEYTPTDWTLAQSYTVGPFAQQETETVIVIPDSLCQFNVTSPLDSALNETHSSTVPGC